MDLVGSVQPWIRQSREHLVEYLRPVQLVVVEQLLLLVAELGLGVLLGCGMEHLELLLVLAPLLVLPGLPLLGRLALVVHERDLRRRL